MITYHKEQPHDRAVMLALRALLAVQPKPEFGPEGRPDFDSLMEQTPEAEGVTYEVASFGGVAGWWCKPEQAAAGSAIAYFHGGAYVLGSAAAYRNFAGQIATRAMIPVFVVDYGLAPEHPFPSAINDAEAVYRGLAASGLSRLAIAGDSAGGGLALALLLHVISDSQQGKLPKPFAAVVMSAWTDLALTGESVTARAKADPLLTRDALDKAARLYLGDVDRSHPEASPLYGNLAGLPPIFLHVGEDEILLDDSRRFVDRVEAAGGSAQLHVWEGMTHVFPSNLSLHAAKDALDNIGVFLQQQLQAS